MPSKRYALWAVLVAASAAGICFAEEQPAPPQFSVTRGFLEAPRTVELSTDTPDAVIRYATDGSWPI